MHALITFLRLWIWFVFRRLRTHLWRTLAVLIGIGLGAAVFTSVRLAMDASLDSFTRSVDALSGKSDWTVLSPGGRVPEHLVGTLIKHPAVEAVSPLSTTYVQLEDGTDELFLLIGLDPILDRSFRSRRPDRPAPTSSPSHPPAQIEDPHAAAVSPSLPSPEMPGLKPVNRNPSSIWAELMTEPFTLIAGEPLYDSLHLETRSGLTLSHTQGKRVFRVLGKLAAEGLGLVESGKIAVTDLATFQEFTGTHGSIERIDLRLRPSAPAGAADSIRTGLPAGITLDQPSEFKESGRLMVRSYQLNLSVLSFVSLFVGMFLVYSLISLHATSRRHELAILRSVGAPSRMVFLLFLSEGAFFGCLGWLIAIPLGSFMVRHLLGHVSNTISLLFVRIQVDRLSLNPWELLLSFLTTLFVSILAAWQPAYEAMQVAPREVFQAEDSGSGHAARAGRFGLFGLVLIGLVWPLSQLPGTGGTPLAGYAATFLLFSGFSLVSPWLLRRIGTVLPPLLRRTAGEPAYLGGRYIRDSGMRIAISVGALITATALFVALVIMIHSFRKTVELWLTQTISGDLYIRPKLAATNLYRDVLPPEVVEVARRFAGEVDVLPYRRMHLHYGTVPYQFEGTDFEGFMKHAQFLFIVGEPQELLPLLKEGRGVIVSEVFANQTGAGVGKRFKAQIGKAHLDLPILGTFRDYRTQGGVVCYSMAHYQEHSGDISWSGVRFNLIDRPAIRDDAANLLRSRVLEALGPLYHGVDLLLGRDLRGMILRIFDETFAITTVLLLIALAVATLGVTSTLTVLVLDRTRQFLTILACGGSRGQVRLIIFWEALIMVFTGEWLGLACGFALSYLLIFVINRQSFGWTFIYAVDWSALLTAFPLILATALLAAIPSSQIVFKASAASVLRDG